MPATIPDKFRDLLDKPVYVTLATVKENGQPHLSVVWCSYDGEHILVNSARGRVKDQNMTDRPMVSILAMDPESPYRWIAVEGTVAEITEEGAVDHINQLAQLYVGKSPYYGEFAPAEQADKETRVIYKIKPAHVVTFDPMG